MIKKAVIISIYVAIVTGFVLPWLVGVVAVCHWIF